MYKWADGKEYSGMWFNDLLNGQGDFKWPDGRVYKGNYIKNVKTR